MAVFRGRPNIKRNFTAYVYKGFKISKPFKYSDNFLSVDKVAELLGFWAFSIIQYSRK
jgi:hypothetical protein